jgi:ankyrin repeat protein
VNTLIKHGCDVNCIDRDSDFPLLLACGRHSTGSGDMVRALLKSGARINQEDKLGENAIRAAAASGLVDVARVLLDNGAAINGYNEKKV